MTPFKLYEYDKCSTCRKATKFLDARKVAYTKVQITERPPTEGEIRKMIALRGGEFRKLFNTSGLVYRELGLGEKVKSMTEAQAVKLLATNGKLIKRPFAIPRAGVGLVGFEESEWKKAFDA